MTQATLFAILNAVKDLFLSQQSIILNDVLIYRSSLK